MSWFWKVIAALTQGHGRLDSTERHRACDPRVGAPLTTAHADTANCKTRAWQLHNTAVPHEYCRWHRDAMVLGLVEHANLPSGVGKAGGHVGVPAIEIANEGAFLQGRIGACIDRVEETQQSEHVTTAHSTPFG